MQPNRIVEFKRLRLVGPLRSHPDGTRDGITEQWAQWDWQAVSGVRGDLVFGTFQNYLPGPGFDYMCALPVEETAAAPAGQTVLEIPDGFVAVYDHDGPVAAIEEMSKAIIAKGPHVAAGWDMTGGPWLEVYGEGFDPLTATGRVELWFPVRKRGQ